jgi:prepilin-type N-terminal cleavage/methylation domain-containing protein
VSRPQRRRGRDPADSGFTLLEMTVALGLIGVVMASTIVFFVQSGTASRKQADTQVAAQYAAGAMEDAGLLTGENVLLNRTEAAVRNQWRVPGVEEYLDPARTELAWQNPATPAPASFDRTLSTGEETITAVGETTKFKRWWYVGLCWQPRGGGDCVVVPAAQRAQQVAMFRIIVAIVWPSSDCPSNRCHYVATMLTERTLDDPVYE